jgi:secreted PhoX family phosphatase
LDENYDGEYSSYYGRSQNGKGELFGEVVARRAGRRDAIKAGLVLGAAASGAASGATASGAATAAAAPADQAAPPLPFQSIPLDSTDGITLAPGYVYDRVLSWGDPLFAGVPAFSLDEQSPGLQALQAGYNCDFLAFFPLPPGSNSAREGLLWVNHEYTDEVMMFRSYRPSGQDDRPTPPTRDQVDIALAAHGASVVHVRTTASGRWEYVLDSRYNRRITGMTPMRISGPAAGDPYMMTSADTNGTAVMGMLNNCGGGWTPWGTVLSAEENFNQYFANRNGLGGTHPQQASLARYGIPGGASERLWERYHDRFDCAREPNEPNRFGWIVEVDPYDPGFVPVKRTALGRLKHEAAAGALAPNGRWVSYTGDDERFEYLYKFVSNRSYVPGNRAHNLTLLDDGTLYVARLNDDGSGRWLPLTFGEGPLTPANGFFSQADVLIRARFAGDALGATKMDRPEDVEVNPVNRRVYMNCTNNTNRAVSGAPGTDAANPRAQNFNGHVIEIAEDGDNYAGTTFRWDIFLLCGDPADPTTYFAGFPKDQVAAGMSSPDNMAFDNRGNLWIATDGQTSRDAFRGPETEGQPATDSIYAVPTAGPFRGQVKRLVNGVPGGEIAALLMGPDSRTLFLSIQHPGEGGSIANPVSHWPDGGDLVARPTVIAVRRQDGAVIGS